ncbi:hypothetical protein ACWEQC_01190 [Streptomyces shenzhenensis]
MLKVFCRSASLSNPSPPPAISTTTGLPAAGRPEQETFTEWPATRIFLAPENADPWAFCTVVADAGCDCVAVASSQARSPAPATVQHSAVMAVALIARIIKPSQKAMG